MKKLIAFMFSILTISGFAQVRPDQFLQETNPANANFEFYSQKGLAYRRASFDNVRKRMLPFVIDTVIGATPSSTGNTTNLGQFIKDATGVLWYIDGLGNAVELVSGSNAPTYVIADTSALLLIYAPSHGLAAAIASNGYVPIKADFTVANSTSVDSIFVAYAIDAPDPDSLLIKFTGALSFSSWHGKEINQQYFLQDNGTEGLTAGTLTVPTAIATDSFTLFLREVGPEFAGKLKRVPIPSPAFGIFGGDSQVPSDSVAQAVILGLYVPAGIAQPGTIFTTSYSGQSNNPTYIQGSPNTNPLTPSFSWLWDGVNATRISDKITSIDLQDALYGGLGTLPLEPIDSIAFALPPTDADVVQWATTNYNNNGLRLPNGCILYYIGTGSRQNPDYEWMIIDDLSASGGTNFDKIIKRIKQPSTGGNLSGLADVDTTGIADNYRLAWDDANEIWEAVPFSGGGLFNAANNNDTIRVSTALLKAALYLENTGTSNALRLRNTNSASTLSVSNYGAGTPISTSKFNVSDSTAMSRGLILYASPAGTPQVGFGAKISFQALAASPNISRDLGDLGFSWQDPASLSSSSKFEVSVYDATFPKRVMQIASTGQLTLDGYANGALVNADSSLHVLTIDATGDVHSIPIDSLGGTGGAALTAGSGIGIAGDSISWNGALTQTTEIDMANVEVKFLRPGGPAVTSGSNLIGNGDFASGTTGWTGAITWDSVNERAEVDNCNDSGCEAYYNFTVSVTGQYLIQFDIQPGAIGSQYTNTGGYAEAAIKMYFVTTLTAGSETIAIANYYQGSGQKMWIDNVSIFALDTLLYDIQIGENKMLVTPGGGFIFGQNPGAALFGNWGFGKSFSSNTTGGKNTASGAYSLSSNTTGGNNTASGIFSLYFNTTGSENTASGAYSLFSNTTGGNNTASGKSSLFSNTTGGNNTASGVSSLYFNTTGSENTASGASSLSSNTTGGNNTSSGAYSLYSNTTGGNNTSSGVSSLSSNTTGGNNTASGVSSLYSNTTGSNNTAVGREATFSGNWTNTTSLGYQAQPTQDNQIVLGNNSVTQLVARNYKFNIDQTVGSGQDGQVLTYNHSIGEIELQAASGGSGDPDQTLSVSNDTLTISGTGGNFVVLPLDAQNLGYTASTRALTISGGAGVTLPLADATNPGLMTSADFTKLGGIAAGAEVNVNADWNAVSGDAQILNKPTISGSNTGDVTLAGTYDYITISGQTITRGQVDYATDISNIPATFAPSAHTLDSHSNVTITSNTSGEILKWNGSAWINNTLAEAGIQPAGAYLTVEVDGSVTNEGLLSVGAGGANDATISSNTAGSQTVTIAGGSNVTITENTGTGVITIAATGDGTGTDDQVVDTLVLTNDVLGISLENDGVAQKTVSLASLSSTTITAVPSADHAASGTRITLTANEAQNFGDVVFINAAGKAQLGDADAIATASCIAMCTQTVSANNAATYLLFGVARDDTWNWTVGGLIYLSVTGTTGNTLTQTAPVGTNNVIQILGVATHADRMLFKPELVQIELN
jgi:hypothetical protein